MSSASISVIIPTYNRASVLARVLPSYLASPSVGEILIIDDGCTDNTQAVVQTFAQQDTRVKLISHVVNQGMTFARNTGIQHACYPLALFSEDDLEIGQNSLEILLEHLNKTQADIIAGKRIWMRLGESYEQALARSGSIAWPVVNTRILEHYSHTQVPDDVESPLVNATMLVRSQVLDQVAFADCYPGNAWREESDFQLTALARGFKIVFCPHAIFYHHDRAIAGGGRNRVRNDLRYLYWIYRNNLTFLKRHRSFLQERYPESLLLGSPRLTNGVYIIYRAALLLQTEVRRAFLSWRYPTP